MEISARTEVSAISDQGELRIVRDGQGHSFLSIANDRGTFVSASDRNLPRNLARALRHITLARQKTFIPALISDPTASAQVEESSDGFRIAIQIGDTVKSYALTDEEADSFRLNLKVSFDLYGPNR